MVNRRLHQAARSRRSRRSKAGERLRNYQKEMGGRKMGSSSWEAARGRGASVQTVSHRGGMYVSFPGCIRGGSTFPFRRQSESPGR